MITMKLEHIACCNNYPLGEITPHITWQRHCVPVANHICTYLAAEGFDTCPRRCPLWMGVTHTKSMAMVTAIVHTLGAFA